MNKVSIVSASGAPTKSDLTGVCCIVPMHSYVDRGSIIWVLLLPGGRHVIMFLFLHVSGGKAVRVMGLLLLPDVRGLSLGEWLALSLIGVRVPSISQCLKTALERQKRCV